MEDVIETLTATKGIHLGIDGNEANVSGRAGTNNYALSLLHAFYQLNSPDTYTIYLKEKPMADLPPERDDWQYRVLKPKPLWTQWRLPLDLSLSYQRPDVFYSPGHFAPRFSPVLTVITIHDLAYLKFPNLFLGGISNLEKLKKWTDYSIKNAVKIVAVSRSTQTDVREHYRIAKERVKVVYSGIDTEEFVPKSNQEIDKVRVKYKLKNEFFLFVGTLQPRKNLIRMLQAFERLPERLKGMDLVIVGKKGWLYQDFIKAWQQSDKKNQVKLLDYVDQDDLPALYTGATAFVQVGLYEGFGLVVLEALACGTPVVVADSAALPETVGDAGILVDPYSVGSITQGLAAAATLSQSKLRQFKKQAKIQVSKFDWEITARKIRRILYEVAVSR